MIKYILIFLILFFVIEAIFTIERNIRRKRGYEKAVKLSKKLGKKLMVIGSPKNGGFNSVVGASYGCGDVCIDLVGCNGCEKSIKGDLLEILKKTPSDKYVIFESCVLEEIDYDINEVIGHIKRISGNNYVNVRWGNSLILYIYYVPSIWTKESSNIKWIEKY